MQITIIQADGVVGVNGVFRAADLSDLDPKIHAVQFNTLSGAGHVEYDQNLVPRRGNVSIGQAQFDALFQKYVARWSAAAPTVRVKTLDELKADKLAELSAACANQIYAGFASSALGTEHIYPALDKDQANLAASVLSSLVPGLPADWTTRFWCKDYAGAWAFRPHTAAQIQRAGLDGKAAIETALQKNATLAAQVQNANEAGLGAITW
jgi:hypothetical protein